MNITKKEADLQIQRQTSGYQWGGGGALQGWESGRFKLLGIRQAQVCTSQHGEYN